MMDDCLALRVRAAVGSVPVPAYPAEALAVRTTSDARERVRCRPLAALAGGAAVLAVALAAAVPAVHVFSPAALATIKRLTGHDWSNAVVTQVDVPMSLDEARRRTRFPIVAPAGMRVLNAQPLPHDDGVLLVLAVDKRAQSSLAERWVTSRKPELEGFGVRDDGTVRRFKIRAWRIGRIVFSTPVFDRSYVRYAQDVERATRDAVASGRSGRSP
jgi:hypothetical protein